MRIFRTVLVLVLGLAKVTAEHEDENNEEDNFQNTIIRLAPVLESIALILIHPRNP